MDIEGSLRELGPVDSNALIEAVLSQDENAWQANQYRQQAYEVHTHTESLVLVFCEYLPKALFHSRPLERCCRYAGMLRLAEIVMLPVSSTIVWLTTWLVPGPSDSF